MSQSDEQIQAIGEAIIQGLRRSLKIQSPATTYAQLGRAAEPHGAVIEVIERSNTDDQDFIVPNLVRINGQEILCPEGAIVEVKPMGNTEAVVVTVTMFAASFTVKHERSE